MFATWATALRTSGGPGKGGEASPDHTHALLCHLEPHRDLRDRDVAVPIVDDKPFPLELLEARRRRH
jgi:hypothetical protein